jgi:hypothetical protein
MRSRLHSKALRVVPRSAARRAPGCVRRRPRSRTCRYRRMQRRGSVGIGDVPHPSDCSRVWPYMPDDVSPTITPSRHTVSLWYSSLSDPASATARGACRPRPHVAGERIPADETAGFVPRDAEAEAGLERRVVRCDVVAPVAIALLHAQRVERVVSGQTSARAVSPAAMMTSKTAAANSVGTYSSQPARRHT